MDLTEEQKTSQNAPKKWTEIAEVRMLMYVIAMGTALALIGLLLSQFSYH
jgi:hypothetical protein